ncbi:MAG: ketopantoate reductase family protein [Candidatus Promineifilaceae bacterium]
MRILIFGAGAVGSYLAGRLAQAGHPVSLVARGPAAEAILNNGLTLVEGDLRQLTTPVAFNSLRQAVAEDPGYEVVLLAMKAYDVEAAVNELVAFYPSAPLLVSLQNGVGVEELLIEEFGAGRVLAAALTTPLSHETYQSVVVERSDRGLALAPAAPGQKIERWVELFAEAGIETIGQRDYRAMKWSKALVNMIGNATSAILNRHPRLIYDYGPTFELEMEMLREALAVMKKLRLEPVDLPGVTTGRLAFAVKRMPAALVKPILTSLVAAGRGAKAPSFHIDLMNGRGRNEVLYHNGAVAAVGAEEGVKTPVNRALTDILLKLVRREVDYELYNGRPARLVAEVERYRRGQA